ncbi:unnamed protein product (macronuclear) [Paramecium tetraurelia]|uniref:Uncharacterized protein n=1 Tax=Paramecium tetraurelia TaxID=5888 RepID=A0DZM2_PARTE|nr:uncharacterized protein GSPATT00021657001 [Paramecium tetraurelia]CAK88489.1 unnamed protein product [Paramecium tetraurelia]|eukprot:XP_001455886.1 hypothetical protein (macronuclear) [Paramecium tetraurelia strain d4-2]
MNINNQLLKIVQDVNNLRCNLQIQAVIKSDIEIKPSLDEILKILKQQVAILIELVQQQKGVEYDQLEKAVQKAEAEIRNHIRVIIYSNLLVGAANEVIFGQSLRENRLIGEGEVRIIGEGIKQVSNLKNKSLTAGQERKISSQNQTRESSPSLFKKTYILGNQVYNRQQGIQQEGCVTMAQNCDSQQTRERRSSGTQHSYMMMKNMQEPNVLSSREKVNMNASQEKVGDKSSTILKSQNSTSLLKMYNIQKLIIKNQQDKQLQQLKNKTINQILDDSQATKKKP